MTDYNDGKWHGWNGGECPVHPESLVEVRFLNTDHRSASKTTYLAHGFDWARKVNPIIAFRVVTPYIEPQEYSGECWAYHFIRMAPSLVSTELDRDCIKGRWTATHVNGEVDEITWKRMK